MKKFIIIAFFMATNPVQAADTVSDAEKCRTATAYANYYFQVFKYAHEEKSKIPKDSKDRIQLVFTAAETLCDPLIRKWTKKR